MRAAPVLLVALAGFAAACGRDARQPAVAPAVPISVATAATRDVPERLDAVATVEPMETVSVKAEAAGRLLAVHFIEGQDVRAGDLLFEVDARPYEAALAEAQGTLARDQATSRNSALQAQRAEELAAQGLISREQHDEAVSTAASQKASVEADAAAVQTAKLSLAYTRVLAPISGRTGSVLVHVGNVVKAADDQPLVVINRIDPIFVTFSVPEQRLGAIQAAQKGRGLDVEAVVAGDTEPVRGGRLTFIDNQVDRTTGTVRLKATFPNPQGRLWPGQFANVRLTLGLQSGAVVIPASAVQPGQQGSYVFVVKADQTVEPRTVVTHPADRADVVVEQGVRAGEVVVSDGQLGLTKGTRVQAKPAVAADAPAVSASAGDAQ